MAFGLKKSRAKLEYLFQKCGGMRITEELARNANSQAFILSTDSETLNLNKSFRRLILHKV